MTEQLKEPTLEDKEEIIRIIKKTQDTTISQATKTRKLLTAHKNWRKNQINLVSLKSPIMIFGRRSGIWEVYEGVTAGEFKYKHTNGEERYVIVNPHTKDRLTDGRTYLPCYMAHEDHPVTGWPDAITTAEQMNMFGEKLLNDMKQWLAKLDQIKNEKWLYIAGGVALILVGFGLMKLMLPQPVAQTIVYTGQAMGEQLIQNISDTANVIRNLTPGG